MITKQDLQQILKLVSHQSVKDTQFPVAKELTGIESMAIVQNGANKITSLTQLVEYVYKNLDLDDIDASYWKKSEEDDSTRELIKDKLRNILTYLYNLASAPYNGDGSKVGADTIEYTNNLIQEAPGTVASALTYVIGLMPNKADLITLGNNKRIPYNQLPQLCLVKMDTPKSAYMNTHSDYYYFNQTTKKINYIPRLGETIIIDPVSNIAYLDLETRNWYTWNPDTQSMDIVKNSAELDNHGTLTPDQWPRTILISATPMTDEEALSKLGDGDLFVKIMDTDEATVAMVMNDAVELVSPSSTVVYYALDENAFYYYNGVEFHKITGSDNNGKADILDNTSMLDPDQWPKVVINNIEGEGDSNAAEGDVVYRTSTRKLYLVKTSDSGTLINVPIGSPKKTTIYCLKSTDALYRWTGSSTTSPWKLITSGGGSNITVKNNGIVLGKSSGGSGNAPNVTPGGVDVVKTFYINSSTYSTYEITKGMIPKDAFGHYSSDQYKTMYKNAKGFTDAIMDAYVAGYTKIVVEKGDYCFTPIFYMDTEDNKNKEPIVPLNIPPIIWILNIDGIEIDLGGSTFHLLVDSSEHSRYYNVKRSTNASVEPYYYFCCLIGIGQSKNVTIKNGYFRGDMYSRDYSENLSSQKKEEGCYGIYVGISPFTYNITLTGLDGSGFCGDFIKTVNYSIHLYSNPFWHRQHNIYGGYEDSAPDAAVKGIMNYGYGFGPDGEKITQSNSSKNRLGLTGFLHIGDWFSATSNGRGYVADEYVIKAAANKEYSIYNSSNNTRMLNCYAPLIQVLTYSSVPAELDASPLRVIKCGYCESFHLYDNEKYVRLQFLYENGLNSGFYRSTDLSSLTEVNKFFGTLLEADDVTEGRTNAPNTVSSSSLEETELDDSEETVGNNADAGGHGPLASIIPKLNDTVLIENCHVHDNGRGGIEGGANNVVIRNCVFTKQQVNATSDEQGALPVFTVKGTNYHISHEDIESNRLTVEGCTFYSGRYTGKLLFPTILNLEFRNNVCYGCLPSVGNCFVVNSTNNVFIGTGITGDATPRDSTKSVSRGKMVRIFNCTNNTYYRCGAPGYLSGPPTIRNINNCYLEINDPGGVEFDDGSLSNVVKKFLSDSRVKQVYNNCHIRFLTDDSVAYFQHLNGCHIEGGHRWFVSRIENCDLVDSTFKIIHNLKDTDGVAAHMYVKNVKGLDLQSRCYPFLTSTMTLVHYDEEPLDYVVHYDDCEIDVSKISPAFLSGTENNSSLPRTYRNVILKFNNCRFVGAASDDTILGNLSGHETYASFANCAFDLSSEYLFGDGFTTNYRYFEFDKCRFSTDGFTLASTVDLVCGGEYGITANRPKLTKPGSMYFDTTVDKPVWRSTALQDLSTTVNSGVNYVDATGNNV